MLTDAAVNASGATEQPRKLFDERGLFLLINPNGSRLWRLKYRIENREKLLAVDAYPDVGLKRAREKRDEARKLIAAGIDPSAKRQAEKVAAAETFEAVGANGWSCSASDSRPNNCTAFVLVFSRREFSHSIDPKAAEVFPASG